MDVSFRREDASTSRAQKNLRVLIVEDDPLSRMTLKALLSGHGYPTQAVSSAEEALQIISDPSDTRHTVALIDLDLPGMNGAQLLRHLKAINPQTHAVIITAASGDRVRELVNDDRIPHLRKPLDFHYLLSLLSEEAGHANIS